MKKIFGWGTVIVLSVLWVKSSLLSHAGDCGKLEKEVELVISAAQKCESDAECSFLTLSCPFECITPMRKGTRKEIIAEIGRYHDSCMPMCPDCPKDELPSVRCVEKTCRVV